MPIRHDEKQRLSEEKKRDKLSQLNEKIIEINQMEDDFKSKLKEATNKKEASNLETQILDLNKSRIATKKAIQRIKITRFKNLFMIKTKYRRLMYSPTRSSLMFRLFIIIVAAFIVTFGLHFFIHPGHKLYTGGLRTVQQIILFAASGQIPEWSTYLIFFGLNIPLAYFGWKYIGKRFTLLTMFFLVIQAGFDELLNVPYLAEHLENLYIIKVNSAGSITSDNASIYLSAAIGAVIYGMGVALTFVAGASSGGTKFVVAWLQKKYKLSLGKSSVYIAAFMITMGLIINGIIIDGTNFFNTFFSTAVLATIVFISIQAFIQNTLAPRAKKTTIHIQTSSIDKVKEVINSTILSKRLWYTYKIKKNEDKKMSSVVVITVDSREAKYIIGKLTRRLPSSLITYQTTYIHSDKYVVRGFD